MTLSKCPGLYCGRLPSAIGNWSDCGACPRGFRSDELSFCVPCDDRPTFYDWLYLGFMALLPLFLHWFCIDNIAPFSGNIGRGSILLHLSALFEVAMAAALTLLIVEPFGILNVRSCQVNMLSDWYTVLHNPNPNYESTLHCTQEAVYPLYTMVFIFYVLGILIMLLLRPLAIQMVRTKVGKGTVYAALYFYPILALLHAVFGGLIYYSFPYVVIILSVISNAAHFAFKLDQSMWFLVMSTIRDLRNVVILIGHWCLHAYGIVALTQLTNPVLHASLIALVPLPAAFYILTARFTDPNKLHTD